MPFFAHASLNFHYLNHESGVPFIFQHGLGATAQQPAELYRPQPGIRFLALDCRGHGETPLGDPDQIGFNTFADDVSALMDALGVRQAFIGGISMGAGVALNFATRFPDRALGLVLSRPAWLDKPMPDNLLCLTEAARFIRQYGAQAGLEQFQQSATYQAVQTHSPDSAASLISQFIEPRAEESVARLERIPADVPCADRAVWAALRVPTLCLGTRRDWIHPFEYAEALAQTIPGATLHELTPKSVSAARYQADTQNAIASFLQKLFTLAH
jgi:pimeloyl-ACP methyl ester carboxylesterase